MSPGKRLVYRLITHSKHDPRIFTLFFQSGFFLILAHPFDVVAPVWMVTFVYMGNVSWNVCICWVARGTHDAR